MPSNFRMILREEGSAAIETAISLSVAFFLAFWLFELSSFTYTLAVLDDAAHEGVRYAITHGADSSSCSGPTTGCADSAGSNVVAIVTSVSQNTLHSTSGMTVTITWPDTTGCKPGSLVKVALRYPYIPYFQALGFSQTASASAEGRIVY